MSRIPSTRNDALYQRVLEIINHSNEPIPLDVLREMKGVKEHMARPSRINDVANCLAKKGVAQKGMDARGRVVLGSISCSMEGFSGKSARGKKKVAQPQSQPAPTVSAPPSVEVVPATPASPLPLTEIAKGFAQEIAAQLAEMIVAELVTILPQQLESLRTETAKKATTRNLPRTVICGLLPQQAGLIQQEFGHRLDIEFVESDEASNTKRIHSLIKTRPNVFAMTNFISHSLDAVVKDAPNFHRVSGGMSSLRNNLNALVEAH